MTAARALLARYPLIDGHNDLPWAVRESGIDLADLADHQPRLQTDLKRLRAGQVGGQFWSVYVPCHFKGAQAVFAVLEQIDLVYRLIQLHSTHLRLATTAKDVEDAFAAGRIASLLGVEGGHCIAGSLGVLRVLHRLGVRYLTLTHNKNTPWAESATDEPIGGLSSFGHEVIDELNRLGMLIDLSHTAVSTMQDTLRVSRAPVVFTHSACRALVDHPRNIDDEVLALLAQRGGICMVTFVPSFVSAQCAAWEREVKQRLRQDGKDPHDLESYRRAVEAMKGPIATLSQVADHLDHARDVAGIDHVGIGSDYDGVPAQPAGLTDVSCYPMLFAELIRRGWSSTDCMKLAGGNIMRVLRDAESVASH